MRWTVMALLAGVAMAPVAASASATFVETIPGNDCQPGANSNGFSRPVGSPISACTYEGSPFIVRFNFDDEGEVTSTELGGFGTIDGTEFSFVFDPGGTGTGTWTYTPDDTDDPDITAFVAKGGPNFNVFTVPAGTTSAAYFTPPSGSGKPAGLSHLTFFDTTGGGGGGGGGSDVPTPAALALFGVGLLGFAAVRRRRRV